MAIYPRTSRSGRRVWAFVFSLPGSSRSDRKRVGQSGFATRREAQEAEARQRVVEAEKVGVVAVGQKIEAGIPTTLGELLSEFQQQHVDVKLAPKTAERYRQQVAYLSPELLAIRIGDVTALRLGYEWQRLLKEGGHHRRTRQARPLSPKTVRNVAGILSSAFSRAIRRGWARVNPVSSSELPRLQSPRGVALTPNDIRRLVDAAHVSGCLAPIIEVDAGTGARRGELLALRWSDISAGRVMIERSLCQTKSGLEFKETKNHTPRRITLPAQVLCALDAHRQNQNVFRAQFGPNYQSELDLVFANPDGSPLKPDSVSAAMSALCRRLGFPKGVSFHTLRHSHGSQLIAAGAALPVVSERLGHSSVLVTAQIYVHAMRGQDDEAVRMWEELQKQSLAADKVIPMRRKPAGAPLVATRGYAVPVSV